MSIDNYGELKTAASNWMPRGDLAQRIPEFVELAEARIGNDLRVREMEATSNVTISASTRTSALPTRFVQARSIYEQTSLNRLEYRTPAEFWSVYAGLATAEPEYYTIEGENFAWGPLPDAGYTAVVSHYARPAAFSADADNNAILTRWPNLYLYATLLEAALFRSDGPMITKWAAAYENMLDRAHDADRRDRASGDVIPPERAMGMT